MTLSWPWSRAKGGWRWILLDALDPRDGALTVDIGCGGGSQVIAIKRRRPGARGIGERTEFNAVGALPGLTRASGLSAVTERDRSPRQSARSRCM